MTEKYCEQNWPKFAERARWQEVDDDHFEVVINKPAVLNTDDYTGERIQKNLKSTA